jgi:hypothetical protein
VLALERLEARARVEHRRHALRAEPGREGVALREALHDPGQRALEHGIGGEHGSARVLRLLREQRLAVAPGHAADALVQARREAVGDGEARGRELGELLAGHLVERVSNLPLRLETAEGSVDGREIGVCARRVEGLLERRRHRPLIACLGGIREPGAGRCQHEVDVRAHDDEGGNEEEEGLVDGEDVGPVGERSRREDRLLEDRVAVHAAERDVEIGGRGERRSARDREPIGAGVARIHLEDRAGLEGDRADGEHAAGRASRRDATAALCRHGAGDAPDAGQDPAASHVEGARQGRARAVALAGDADDQGPLVDDAGGNRGEERLARRQAHRAAPRLEERARSFQGPCEAAVRALRERERRAGREHDSALEALRRALQDALLDLRAAGVRVVAGEVQRAGAALDQAEAARRRAPASSDAAGVRAGIRLVEDELRVARDRYVPRDRVRVPDQHARRDREPAREAVLAQERERSGARLLDPARTADVALEDAVGRLLEDEPPVAVDVDVALQAAVGAVGEADQDALADERAARVAVRRAQVERALAHLLEAARAADRAEEVLGVVVRLVEDEPRVVLDVEGIRQGAARDAAGVAHEEALPDGDAAGERVRAGEDQGPAALLLERARAADVLREGGLAGVLHEGDGGAGRIDEDVAPLEPEVAQLRLAFAHLEHVVDAGGRLDDEAREQQPAAPADERRRVDLEVVAHLERLGQGDALRAEQVDHDLVGAVAQVGLGDGGRKRAGRECREIAERAGAVDGRAASRRRCVPRDVDDIDRRVRRRRETQQDRREPLRSPKGLAHGGSISPADPGSAASASRAWP